MAAYSTESTGAGACWDRIHTALKDEDDARRAWLNDYRRRELEAQAAGRAIGDRNEPAPRTSVDVHKARVTGEEREHFRRLFRGGMTVTEIARRCSRDWMTVKAAVREG